MTIVAVATEVAEMIENRSLPSISVILTVPDIETDEPLGSESYGFAEGQSFIIEYKGSGGAISRRPITVFSIEAGAAGVALLKARCHLRKSMRAFRLDRIICCIDFDGEIHDDVPRYMIDNFGMHPGLASLTVRSDSGARWNGILRSIQDDAIILAAMAHADGEFHPAEGELVVDHLARIAEREVMLTEPEILALGRYARKLRPGMDRILLAFDGLSRKGSAHCQRLLHACAAVMDADGTRRPEERRLLSSISRELLGASAAI